MADKPVIKIGHIKITDHLVLGVTKERSENGEAPLQYSNLETIVMTGWNEVGDAICEGSIDGACILAPYAMDLFKSGEKIKLLLFTHKTGSVLIKNRKANIRTIEDFKGKTVIIPYQLSVHNMLFHKLLTEKGLTTGPGKDVLLEVFAPSQILLAMQLDEDGEIGGFIVAEPFGTQVVKEGFGEEFALSKDIWPNHPCCVLVVKEDIINKYTDAVQELINSLVSSGQFIENNTRAASEIGAKFLDQDVDVIEKVLTQPKDRIKTDELKPVVEDLAKMHEYMSKDMNIVKGSIDLNEFVDLKFAETARAK